MSLWRSTRNEMAGAWRSLRYDLARRADGHDDPAATRAGVTGGTRTPRLVAASAFGIVAVTGAAGSYLAVVNGVGSLLAEPVVPEPFPLIAEAVPRTTAAVRTAAVRTAATTPPRTQTRPASPSRTQTRPASPSRTPAPEPSCDCPNPPVPTPTSPPSATRGTPPSDGPSPTPQPSGPVSATPRSSAPGTPGDTSSYPAVRDSGR